MFVAPFEHIFAIAFGFKEPKRLLGLGSDLHLQMHLNLHSLHLICIFTYIFIFILISTFHANHLSSIFMSIFISMSLCNPRGALTNTICVSFKNRVDFPTHIFQYSMKVVVAKANSYRLSKAMFLQIGRRLAVLSLVLAKHAASSSNVSKLVHAGLRRLVANNKE